MPNPLKITADTKSVRKSILDLGRALKNATSKASPVSIFDEKERAFLKTELKRSLEEMNRQFSANKSTLNDLINQQLKLTKGSEAELKVRQKILTAYKDQAKLGKNIASTKSNLGGDGGGFSMKNLAKGGILAAGSAVFSNALSLGAQGNKRYREGMGDRVRLQGLGVPEDRFSTKSPRQLAAAGLNETGLIRRRVQSTADVGLSAGSERSVIQRASFERAKGLEDGKLDDIMAQLRPSLGGGGANDAQLKLQAGIQAAGITDALGPYLEVVADLLGDINKNGLANSDEMIRLFSGLASDKVRTPEQISTIIQTINDAMKNSSGEANALFQVAFASAGIGGGRIGSTQLAIEDGLFAPNRDTLKERGYSDELLDSLASEKRLGGGGSAGNRSSAALSQIKQMANVGEDSKLGEVGVREHDFISKIVNSVFKTKGSAGFDLALLLEKRSKSEISEKDFKAKVDELTKDPTALGLDKINTSLSGNAQMLKTINDTLKTELGKNLITATNLLVTTQKTALESLIFLADAERNSGVINAVKSARDYVLKGIGGDAYEVSNFGDTQKAQRERERKEGMTFPMFGAKTRSMVKRIEDFFTPTSDPKEQARHNEEFWSRGKTGLNDIARSSGLKVPESLSKTESSPKESNPTLQQNNDELKKLNKNLTQNPNKNASSKSTNNINIQTVLPDGQVSNSTFKR